MCKAALSNWVCVGAESSLWKASVQSVSLSAEEMRNSWSSSKHSLTSQVTPSEPPHSLTKSKLLLLLKPGRYGGTGSYYMVQTRWRKRVVCGWLADTKI